jgi:hypothetical protein
MSASGRNRTCDLALRRHSLYPLSYFAWIETVGPSVAPGAIQFHTPIAWR